MADLTDLEWYEEELRLKRRLDEMRTQVPPPSVEEAMTVAKAYTHAYYQAARGVAAVESYTDG